MLQKDFDMSLHFTFLSFLPILILLIVSLAKGVKAGIYSGFAVTSILFFLWGREIPAYLASLISALVGTINILMIIFGAVFLYQVMEQKNFISGIKNSLAEIHPEKSFRFYFLAFFLTAFFESVAGFGTPGAIVPLLLMSLGYSAILSIATVLLIDGLFAMAGAVGTPVFAGLEIPLQLSPDSVSNIYLFSGLGVFFSGMVIAVFVPYFLKKEGNNPDKGQVWRLYFSIMIPLVAVSFWMKELTGILAAVAMALISYFFFFKNKKIRWKPWIPYVVLVLLLLLPKISLDLAELIAYRIEFFSLLGTEIGASIQPLKSPLIPFLVASAFALFQVRDFRVDLKPVVSKTFTVFLVLFPSLAITQLMLNSGTEDLPSMITSIAGVFVQSGAAYPFLSPLIGVLGTFISGSTTVSNIIFGSVQQSSAISLGLDQDVVLSMQLVGASLGNAICLFNIIAAAAVAGVSDYRGVLKMNVLPVFLASLVVSVGAYVLIWFIN
jgi:lactate permease